MSQVASLLPILGLRALTGIGEAAVFVGAATLIADLSPAHRRAEGASYFSVAVFTGLGVGPVFGEWLLDDVQFERAFLVASVFAVLASVVALLAPARVVSADAAATRADDTAAGGGSAPGVPAVPTRTGFQRFVHPAALGPGIVLACGVGGLTSFFLFIPDHARTVGMGDSGLLFATYAAVSLVVRLLGATLPERLGVRRAVSVALTTTGSGLLLLAVVSEVWALWVSAALVGLGAAFNYPSLMALTVNRVSEEERATAISSFTMFFEIGTAASGLAVGGLGQLVGKQAGFLGGVVFCAVGLVVLRTRIAPAAPAAPSPASVPC